jgi:hypothetical protein
VNTATALNQALPRRTRQTIAQQRVARRRQSLASILESALDPRAPLRDRVRGRRRIPAANRAAVVEPLEQIAMLLRDPALPIPERTLRRVLAFVTDLASPVYGEYPSQACLGAYLLIDEVRAHTSR